MVLESELFNFKELEEQKANYEKETYNLYIKYKYIFDKIDDKTKSEYFKSEEKALLNAENINYLITFDEFIKSMENQN